MASPSTAFSPKYSVRVRYILGLAVIALLVTASYLTMQRVISEQRNFTQLIGLASHQSGLANRIAYFATQMVVSDDDIELNVARAQVGQAINRMQAAHSLLREGAPAEGIPRVTSPGLDLIYEDPMAGLDLALERFLERARTLYQTDNERLGPGSAAYVFLTTYGPHALEPMFDAVVEEYERIGREAILAIERRELAIWIAALCTLLLEALIIFRPMERRVHEALLSLRQTVSELEGTRERLLAAQGLAMVGDWHWDAASGGLSWSPEACRIFGLSPAEQEPTPDLVMAMIHPDDRGACRAAIATARGGTTSVSLDCRLRRPDGQERLVYQQIVARRDPGGTLRGLAGIVQDVTERKRTEDQIRKLALFDPLTGLANRRLLRERMEQAMTTVRRYGTLGAALMLDLDNFKSLNDTRGHDIGDAFLVEVAKRLRASVRESDAIARLGGDEFVVVLESLGRDEQEAHAQALRIAEKLRRELSRPYQMRGQGQGYQTSASIGVALFRGADTKVEDLLRRADIGMFEAKELGRNRVCFFSDARQAAINSRTSMLHDLKHALHHQDLRIHYQPQVSASGELRGAEALLRWQPPGRDLVSPGAFIPLAEETGLILDLGEWVLDRVCADLSEMERQALPEGFAVAINISPRQFSDSGLSSKIRGAIEARGLNVERLKLELTEGSFFQDFVHAGAVIQELRGMGLRIELDDFGTGYSSLSALKSLPLDALKLDRTLVQGIADDGRGIAILRAAVAIAKALSLKVIAEGVETPEQHARLIQEGCDLFQGYLFARPMPLEAFLAQLSGDGAQGDSGSRSGHLRLAVSDCDAEHSRYLMSPRRHRSLVY